MNVNKISLSMSGAGDGAKWFPTKCIQHGQIIEWIKKKGYGDRVTQELIKIAKNYPNSTLHVFKKNFNTHVKNVRKKYEE